jgi:tRNA pseudouridine13 synthase
MDLLENIGIRNFKVYGLKGELFKDYEDFIVQEIGEDGTVLSIDKEENKVLPIEKKDYVAFTLVKKGLSSQDAIRLLSKSLKVSFKRIAYNGNKDRNAITSQKMSIFKLSAEKLVETSDKFFFRDISYSDEPCKIGRLRGNRFTVIARHFEDNKNDLDAIKHAVLNGIPNFYGPQRFGTGSLNIDVSRSIINRKFDEAFYIMFLKERPESVAITKSREQLREIFSGYVLEKNNLEKEKAMEILSLLPHSMEYERRALLYIIEHRNDYIGAIRILPKYFRLLILQSYQYYLYNRVLSLLLERGLTDNVDISTVGYDMQLTDDDVGAAIKEVLVLENVTDLSRFKIEQMPEASLKSFKRNAFVFPNNFYIKEEDGKAVIKFDLDKGSYATILLLKLFGYSA